MIWKIIYPSSIVLLISYILLWLANYFMGSATQCGDGFGATWRIFLLAEMIIFGWLYTTALLAPSTVYKAIIFFVGCMALMAYTLMFVRVTLQGYQHCGAGEFQQGNAGGLDAVWPVFLQIFHLVWLLILLKKLKFRRG